MFETYNIFPLYFSSIASHPVLAAFLSSFGTFTEIILPVSLVQFHTHLPRIYYVSGTVLGYQGEEEKVLKLRNLVTLGMLFPAPST